MTSRWGALLERVSGPVLIVVFAALAGFVGVAVIRSPTIGLVIVLVVLAVGLTLVQPMILPLLAMPLLVVILRVGAATNNLALADLVLALALVVALVLGRRPYSPPMAWLIVLAASYQFLTLFTVVLNPFSANTIEWVHAGVLVAGALVVGWAVGRDGWAAPAVNLLMLSILLIAVGTFLTAAENYARGDFGPVYPSWPYPMHKNFAGPILGIAATVAYVRPPWLGWYPRLSRVFFGVCVAGALLTQSRQALIGLGVVLVLFVLRRPVGQRRSRAVIVVALGLLAVSTFILQDQLGSGNRFNSAQQRLTWFSDAVTVWQQDPWFGQGLRWWYSPQHAGGIQPPNVELEQLTSAGIVGLVALLLLFGGAFVVLRRVDPAYALMPIMVLGCRAVQSQFDLFWVAVMGSVPWLLVGLSLGAHAHDLAATAPPGGRGGIRSWGELARRGGPAGALTGSSDGPRG